MGGPIASKEVVCYSFRHLFAADAEEKGVAPAAGRVSVRGYTRKDGTYVRPHTRSYPGSGGRKR
jgi:hypothetical protein